MWLLYLAGAALAFEENRMGVHQVLLVRPDAEGRSGLPRGRSRDAGRATRELDRAARTRRNGSARASRAAPTR